MAQPFGIGDVVGGRYRITHHVVTSADQDIVFQGVDQVLNREVSILLASTQNAKQVATSAKELATGERSSEVQVLDLGLTEDRTYLISTQTHPNDLLDLVVPDSAPYVEPFFTDSLGSELFGQSRVMEPETFDDDAEYYAGLQQVAPAAEQEPEAAGPQPRRRPAFLGRVSESLNRRLGTHRDADRLQGATSAPSAASAEDAADVADAENTADSTDSPDSAEAPEGQVPSSEATGLSGAAFSGAAASTPTDAAAQSPRQEAGEPLDLHSDMELVSPRPEADAEEEFGVTVDETGRLRPFGTWEDTLPEPKTPEGHPEDDGEEVVDDPPAAPVPGYGTCRTEEPGSAHQTQPPAAGLASRPGRAEGPSFTGLISAVPDERRTASRRAAAAAPAAGDGDAPEPDSASADSGAPAAGVAAGTSADSSRERSAPGRWIGVALLTAVVLIAAVIAFFALRGGGDSQPVAEDEETSQQDEEAAEDEEASEPEQDEEQTDEADEAESDGPLTVSSVSRVVPDSPELNEDTDGQLSNTIDGDTSTTWSTFSYGTAEFGGFATDFGLVLELEEAATVSEVTLVQQGQVQDGSFEVLVNDSPDLDGAEQVGSGTWNWSETTVELDDGAEGQYVIINTTALPERLDPQNPDLPYGLELADIIVE